MVKEYGRVREKALFSISSIEVRVTLYSYIHIDIHL